MMSILLNRLCGLAFLVMICCMDSSALAVHPGRWVHTNEADFAPGKNKDTVVTNLGDVKLATGTRVVAELHEQASIIYDMQVAEGGEVYLAAGPETKLLRRLGDKAQVVVSLSGEQIFALDSKVNGKLLVGISGSHSRLAVLEGDKLRTLVKLTGVRYIWDMAVIGERVYLATGTEGRLLEVDLSLLEPVAEAEAEVKPGAEDSVATTGPSRADSSAEINHQPQGEDEDETPAWPVGVRQLVDARQANLLCLGRDESNRLFFGTDTDGLIYRITLDGDGGQVKESFVLYDAPEPEIGALLVLPNGTVYAGTADADQARPGRLTEAAASEAGRPADEKKQGEKPSIEEPQKPGDIPNVPPKPQPSNRGVGSPQEAGEFLQPDGEDAPVGGPAEEEPSGLSIKPGGQQGGGWDRGEVAAKLNLASGRLSKEQNHKELVDRIRRAIQERAVTAVAKKMVTELDQKPSSGQRGRQPTRGIKSGGPSGGPPAVRRQGNALYKIDVNGFVTEVFRESVMIVKLGWAPSGGGKVLVATGNEGLLYSVDPGAEETVILADLESQQIPAILTMSDGQVYLGTANPAEIVELDRGYAHSGAFTSPVFDAEQIGLWGKLNLTATIPNQTAVSVETRSGNVEDPDHAAWSAWSEPRTLGRDDIGQPLSPIEVSVGSPPARFLQYRLSFEGDGKATAVVGRVEIVYVVPNLKPVIQSIRAAYPLLGVAASPRAGGAPGARAAMLVQAAANEDIPNPPATLNIEWEAVDANNDRMKYKLEYQPAGSTQWLPLAEDLDASSYEWQVRRVPDGRYLVRVEATDSPDNTADMAKRASRVSDPVLIDNTPPQINDLHVGADAGVVSLSSRVEDNLSPIQRIDYAVDSTKEWQAVLPEDLIYDSTKESVATTITDLEHGPHVVTIRAIDGLGNASYKAVQVEVR